MRGTVDYPGCFGGISLAGLRPQDLGRYRTFAYDLEGNRVAEVIDGGSTVSGGSTVTYTYNGDNQLQTQTEHTHGQTGAVYQTTSTYDNDGNLVTQATTGSGAQSSTYGYDERNNMTSATTTADGTTTTTNYTYDDNGVLTSETTNAGSDSAATAYYLNDPHNPTGYTKAIQQSFTAGGAPTLSFVFGSDVIAQTDATNGTLYLIHDGHGSTRMIVNSTGNQLQTYDYDSWGDALNFDPSTAITPWLFGGDGTYDPASGFVYQLARWREGLYFTQRDTFQGVNQDPLSLHRYLYAGADPTGEHDPSGHDSDPYDVLDEDAYSVFAEAQSTVEGLEQAYDDVSSGLSLSDQAFALAEVTETDEMLQGAAIQSVIQKEVPIINEKNEQNWQLFELQWEAGPEGQLADPFQFVGVTGEGAISLTVTFAEEGWQGLIGIAETEGPEVLEAVEAAEAVGGVDEAILLIGVLAL